MTYQTCVHFWCSFWEAKGNEADTKGTHHVGHQRESEGTPKGSQRKPTQSQEWEVKGRHLRMSVLCGCAARATKVFFFWGGEGEGGFEACQAHAQLFSRLRRMDGADHPLGGVFFLKKESDPPKNIYIYMGGFLLVALRNQAMGDPRTKKAHPSVRYQSPMSMPT